METPIKVLIADDDPEILKTYESMLDYKAPHESTVKLQALSAELFESMIAPKERRPIKTTTCTQGDQAVALARKAAEDGSQFDVVILDIKMPPGMNGIEAARLIRSNDASIPIVFVSGYSGLEEDTVLQQVPPAEKVHYFSKPIQFIELANSIADMTA